MLPTIYSELLVVDVIQCYLRLQYCRSPLVIFDFLSSGLPRLSNILFNAHQAGSQYLEENYLLYAPLVRHIYHYVHTIHQVKHQKSQQSPNNLTSVPYSLFDVRPQSSGGIRGSSVHLGDPGSSKSLKEVYATGCLFKDIIEEQLVLPFIPGTNAFFNNKHRRSTQPKASRALAIVHRAVIQAFGNHIGNESIFASQTIHDILTSPTLLFYANHKEETCIAPPPSRKLRRIHL